MGDADQGVYSWRGATIQNILDFERDYPDAQVFLMEQNYRSTQNILAVANALIEHNTQRKPKELWTEAGTGELVTVRFRGNDEHEEALFVADEIERLRDDEGYRYRDVAVFYRTNAHVPRASRTSSCGSARPTACSAACGSTSARRSRTSSATCGCCSTPQDVISFRRVVNMPKRGIGDATVAALESFARDEEIDVVRGVPRASTRSPCSPTARRGRWPGSTR